MTDPDQALLRRYEPCLRFTRGEWFLPVDAEPYVRASSLWLRARYSRPVQVEAQGMLTLDRLGALPRVPAGAAYYLRLVDPEDELQAAVSELPRRSAFRAGRGRLARVGYGSRIVDALFSLSLLGRGRVPRLTAHVARHVFRAMQAKGAQPTYHGRVVRTGHWTVLQYWLLYPFNNWRTGFHGANDHEGDWELICVYLAGPPGRDPEPEWVACAAHNERGDDLRRRWDDPELTRSGDHPVLWVAAGSHACYFRPGEYLNEIEVSVGRPLVRAAAAARSFWEGTLRQYAGQALPADHRPRDVLTIPFVDYARGDGDSLGPGQELRWGEPRLLHPTPAWVSGFRGLWGMDARDPLSGENAPAGPMYQGDGGLRHAWVDPAGWCGLSKVAPAHCAAALAREEVTRLRERQTALREEIADRDRELLGLGAAEAALEAHAERLERGEREPPRAHLHRPSVPTTPRQLRLGRVAEAWAAGSAGLFIVVFALLLVFERTFLLGWLALMVGVFLLIESALRGWLINFVTFLAMVLAVASALVLLVDFFAPAVVLLVLGVGAFLLWQNLRELRG